MEGGGGVKGLALKVSVSLQRQINKGTQQFFQLEYLFRKP